MVRTWYDVHIVQAPEYDGKHELGKHHSYICPRCGTETEEQVDGLAEKTSGYICPNCDLRTDR